MKTYYKCILVILVFCLFACDNNEQAYFYSPDELKYYEPMSPVDTIMGEKIETDSVVTVPFCIRSVGPYVIINNNDKDNCLFNVFNSANDSLIAQFGQIGHARNEFYDSPYDYTCKIDNSSIYLYPVEQKYEPVKEIDLIKSIDGDVCQIGKIYKINDLDEAMHLFLLNGGKKKLVHRMAETVGDPRDNCMITPYIELQEGNKRQKYCWYPNIIDGEYGFINCAYASNITVSPNSKKFVEMLYFQDQFTIFDTETKKSLGVRSRNSHDYEQYQIWAKSMNIENAAKLFMFYNMAICLSDDYIFIIHSGEIPACDPSEAPNTTRNIQVFDYKGNIVTSFVVNEPLFQITYNYVTKKLYGFERYSCSFYKYDLSKYLK